uniref:LAGLIDADG homing endonuclease n=1 Tax=Cyathus jiayuguanensis TaxID=380660 RepID=UPI0023F279E7
KTNLPGLTAEMKEIAIGMILSDACMYKTSKHPLIKFEQGYLQKEFLFYLFFIFKPYCFMLEPGNRITLHGNRKGLIKSYWFKTFSHSHFEFLWNLFYPEENGQYKTKKIVSGTILNHLTERGLAYWIMGDGSLSKNRKTMILHTQGYSHTENLILSKELNEKFGFSSEVISHKKKYFVIKFNPKDAKTLHNAIKPFIIDSMKYKLRSRKIN